jgi:uncharacterized protein YkwD
MFVRKSLQYLSLTLLLCGATAASAEFSATSARCAGVDQPIPGEHRVIRGAANQKLFSAVMLRETNIQRCAERLPPLRDTPRFQRVTNTHSEWMANAYVLSHTSTKPGWETLKDRLGHIPVKITSGSENLALVPQLFVRNNQPFRRPFRKSCNWILEDGSTVRPHSYNSLARYTVERLMASPGHRKNILDHRATHHTASTIIDRKIEPCGTHFITQNFVALR